ncbi:flagellar hook-length control protein FliK [Kluyvera sichuanensis]|uniref:Flagellar hook-length control protein FliK n=1 Tax=Kluyvera sichuanensis TaxID=2725494 RepID=A0ABR6RYT2_9ENTR|nr:flagellar hook-length control protein FliK [Kluyvera sichuanensis]MBC1188289.1 flagellar hook-length control protein FliK [Kluyvera sichuanensis]
MITLPNLAVSDANLAGADATAKTPGSPEDFLALLAGALTQSADPGSAKTALLSGDDAKGLRDIKVQGQSLTKWLVQQEATQANASAESDGDFAASSDAQALLSSLAAHLKSELTTGKADVKSDDDSAESKLSDDDLKSLSALMAMLPVTPPIQQAATVTAPVQNGDALSSLTTALSRGGAKSQGFVDVKGTPTTQTGVDARTLPADSAFVIPTQKAESESVSSPTAATAALAPVANQNHAAPVLPAAATANIRAQLGTPDWQQNVSQHITLFTRSGQQTAELRLHPESLGQVHITLKVEDNLAQIQMASPHSHVRAALEAALPVLRTQLEESGIQLGQSNISSDGFAGQQQQPSSQQSFAARSDADGRENQDDNELLAVPAALQSAARGDNAVDIFA